MQHDYFVGVAHALRRGRTVKGWSLLGSGHFARVYHNPEYPEIVLKISGDGGYGDADAELRKGYHSSYQDYGHITDCYVPYAKWCMENRHLRGVPHVHLVEQLTHSLWVTVLQRVSLNGTLGVANGKLPAWLKRFGMHKVGWYIQGHIGYDGVSQEKAGIISKIDEDVVWEVRRAVRAGEPYALTIRALRQFFLTLPKGTEVDLHSDNYRFDRKGNLYFTDPFCGER